MLTLGKPGRRYDPIQIDAPFYQAGLAGYSDAAMRVVARRHGCPYCITEAMLDHFLIQGGKGLDHARLMAGDHGRSAPLCGQLMGSHADEIAQGAKILVDLGYDVVDVNLACPVKKIKKKARGGHLLSVPDEAIGILEAVADAVGQDVPLTVKLRRSYDDAPESFASFEKILRAVIDLGYSGATVHSRTVQQKYLGPGSWDELRQIVSHFGLRMADGGWTKTSKAPLDSTHPPSAIAHPPFTLGGSGDIWEAADIFRMIEQTGVHWVSVARGCIGNPWIFEQARAIMRGDTEAARRSPTIHQQRDVLREHFELSVQLHGEHQAGKMMRKFGIKFSRHHPDGVAIKQRFIKVRSLDDWRGVLSDFYADDGPGAPYERTIPEEAEYVTCGIDEASDSGWAISDGGLNPTSTPRKGSDVC
ncbi:tRNA-dihydrouridine synthase [Phycisphaeraceae bacterium D3-23]